MPLQLDITRATHVGGRELNEDASCSLTLAQGALLAVADGLGGHQGGELASNAFCRALERHAAMLDAGAANPLAALAALYQKAARELQDSLRQQPNGQQARTTCAIAWITASAVNVITVGDTRVYLLRNLDAASWRSRDHSVAELAASEAAEGGGPPPADTDQARLYKSLGLDAIPDVSPTSHEALAPGDVLALCSDGVWATGITDDLFDLALAGSFDEAVQAVVVRAAGFEGPDSDNTTLAAARLTPSVAPLDFRKRLTLRPSGSRVALGGKSWAVAKVVSTAQGDVTYLVDDAAGRRQWLREFSFASEGRALVEARWSAIRGVSAVTWTDHSCLLLMEAVPQAPLGWPLPKAMDVPADLSARVLAALARLHESGFTHGNLRMRNVIPAPDGAIAFVNGAMLPANGQAEDVRALCAGLARLERRLGDARRAELLERFLKKRRMIAGEILGALSRAPAPAARTRHPASRWLLLGAILLALAGGSWLAYRNAELRTWIASLFSTRAPNGTSPAGEAPTPVATVPKLVDVQFEIKPDGESVLARINGAALGADRLVKLPPGEYEIEVSRAGYEPYRDRIVVPGDVASSQIPIELRPQAPPVRDSVPERGQRTTPPRPSPQREIPPEPLPPSPDEADAPEDHLEQDDDPMLDSVDETEEPVAERTDRPPRRPRDRRPDRWPGGRP